MGTHQPKEGHPSKESVLKTWNLALTHYSKKLKPGDNCHCQPSTSMVPHQPKDGRPPKPKLQNWNLALRPTLFPMAKFKKKWKMAKNF